MGRNVIETVLGAVVLAVAGFFLIFAYKTADMKKVDGYTVTANFANTDGLKTGSDVKVNGVKVGTVLSQELITEPGENQYLVRVMLNIDPRVLLPTDTVAMIANESLLGGRYLSLEVGVDDSMIKTDGEGRIARTQPPMRLDDLIGQLIFNAKKGDQKSGATDGAAAGAAADHP